jgi:hypothetical protein
LPGRENAKVPLACWGLRPDLENTCWEKPRALRVPSMNWRNCARASAWADPAASSSVRASALRVCLGVRRIILLPGAG